MSELTLDEAIKHCLEVAENNEQFASGKWIGSEGKANRQECEQCAADHRQLAEWLMELKDLRAEQNDQYTFIRELMDELKEAKRLLKTAVSELNNGTCVKFCSACANVNTSKCQDYKKKKYIWVHTDEALNVIGDEQHESTLPYVQET